MINNAFLTKNGKKGAIDITGKRYDEISSLTKNDLSSILKIGDNDFFDFYTDWYILNDGLYYFKTKFIFNELFLSELAHEFNLKCVEYKVAYDKNNIGIISKNFRKRKSLYYNFNDFCHKTFNGITEELNSFKRELELIYGISVTEKLIDEIFSLVSFDFFSGQNDRTFLNVLFETNSSDIISLAPLTDNGLAFDREDMYSYISCFGSFYFPYDNVLDSFQINTLKLIKGNVSFYNNLCKALDININEVLLKTLEKYKFKMSMIERCKVNDYFSFKKDIIERSLVYSNKI